MKLRNNGFTLIELMIVIAMMSILATMALPSFQDRIIRTQVKEAFNLAEVAQDNIADYYKSRKKFPKNNAAAGLPVPEKMIGNYVEGVKVTNGVIEVKLGKGSDFKTGIGTIDGPAIKRTSFEACGCRDPART